MKRKKGLKAGEIEHSSEPQYLEFSAVWFSQVSRCVPSLYSFKHEILNLSARLEV